mmetsp:Transcript_20547/g.55319  ORF Transcript_20547/g.55319 Transcript_20547/m.55319 type:complete len:289 (+) Transcript_20547:235-1101(+)
MRPTLTRLWPQRAELSMRAPGRKCLGASAHASCTSLRTSSRPTPRSWRCWRRWTTASLSPLLAQQTCPSSWTTSATLPAGRTRFTGRPSPLTATTSCTRCASPWAWWVPSSPGTFPSSWRPGSLPPPSPAAALSCSKWRSRPPSLASARASWLWRRASLPAFSMLSMAPGRWPAPRSRDTLRWTRSPSPAVPRWARPSWRLPHTTWRACPSSWGASRLPSCARTRTWTPQWSRHTLRSSSTMASAARPAHASLCTRRSTTSSSSASSRAPTRPRWAIPSTHLWTRARR